MDEDNTEATPRATNQRIATASRGDGATDAPTTHQPTTSAHGLTKDETATSGLTTTAMAQLGS